MVVCVCRYTCRGLFECHKLLFSFHMCAKILEVAGKLNMEEYSFFLRGGLVRTKLASPLISLCWCKQKEELHMSNITNCIDSISLLQHDTMIYLANQHKGLYNARPSTQTIFYLTKSHTIHNTHTMILAHYYV